MKMQIFRGYQKFIINRLVAKLKKDVFRPAEGGAEDAYS